MSTERGGVDAPDSGSPKRRVKKKAKSTKSTGTVKTAKKTRAKSAKAASTPKAKTAKTRVRKRAKASAPAEAVGHLRVRQVRSTVRRQKTLKRTLEALGIRHHQGEVVVRDTPSTRGMLQKVRHLVRVTPEES